MYTKLQSREQTTRRALDAGKPERVVRRDVQRLVVGYEGLVARFPRNGYADNALWQAAFLAADTLRALPGRRRSRRRRCAFCVAWRRSIRRAR